MNHHVDEPSGGPSRSAAIERSARAGALARAAFAAAWLAGSTTGCLAGAEPGDPEATGDPAKTGETIQETVYGVDNRHDVLGH